MTKITKTVCPEGVVKYRNPAGELHNIKGRPAVIYPHKSGKLYFNTDAVTSPLPMICGSGEKYWVKNNVLHNERGPSITCPNGDKYWYLNGKQYSEQEWKDEMFKRCFKQ